LLTTGNSNLVRRLQQFTQVPDDLMEDTVVADSKGGTDGPVKKFPQRIKRSGY